jgi:hypothetical protein
MAIAEGGEPHMTRATRTAVLIATLLLVGCGGGDDSDDAPLPDYSTSFVGRWDGTFSMTMAGESDSAQVYVPITRTGTNSILLGGFCTDGSGMAAEITSSSSFRVDGLTCPPEALGTCSAVSFKYERDGTGTLASGELTMNITGSLSGCGQTFPFTTTFVGARTSADPQALTIERDHRVETETVAGAIAAQLDLF